MESFLEEVVSDLLNRETDFSNVILVVPGNRPKAFIKKTFKEKEYSGILPSTVSIEEFLMEVSGRQLIKGIPLWFKTFKAYRKMKDAKDLEDFLRWAPTLLKDFDDIDSSCIEAESLFSGLRSEERIKKWGKTLEIGQNEVLQNHIGFWGMAQTLYQQLHQQLKEDTLAYRGLLSRIALERIKTFSDNTSSHYYFVGFNALTKAEQGVIDHLCLENRAHCYWDTDVYYMENHNQEAGKFLRTYKKKQFHTPFHWEKAYFEQPKNIEIVSVPKQVSQAKFVGKKLGTFTNEQRKKTAIVLADEGLLPAVLNALPEEVNKLNITMGLPLSSVPVSYFFGTILKLHYNQEKFGQSGYFYYKDVLEVLSNPEFKGKWGAISSSIQQKIIRENKVFVTSEELCAEVPSLLQPLFESYKAPLPFLEAIVQWIDTLQEKEKMPKVEKEYLFRFQVIFQQLLEINEDEAYLKDFKILKKLYAQIVKSETLSFLGEPLVGLQLLGVLETRLLDFENIIVTSVNEGTFPVGRQENTFIPFVYRTMFGMNTFLENDAIYAYHFYHLLQRSKNVTLIYSTDAEGMGKGEPSRFLLQLEMESPHKISKKIATIEEKTFPTKAIEISKTEKVMERLHQWSRKISPSSLSTYLWNPLDFYERYVLGIRENEEVEEIAGDQTLGTIVHNTLEQLYLPYLGEILNEEIFLRIENNKDKILQHQFNELLLKGNKPRGKNLLIQTVASEMVAKAIEKDKWIAKANELCILDLEREYTADIALPDGRTIRFAGKIDRIDALEGIPRVIDYKTGGFLSTDIQITEKKIEHLSLDKKYSKAIQLLIYAYLYLSNAQEKEVSAGIFPLRYFSREVELLSIGEQTVLTKEAILEPMQQIIALIEEIIDPNVPFIEHP